MGIVSGIVTPAAQAEEAELLTSALWSDLPPAATTALGTRRRLGSGLWVVRAVVSGTPLWLPDLWATKADGTLYTLAWATLGAGASAKTLLLKQGSTQPSVAGGWVASPDLCVDTSGADVEVNGYALLQGDAPNASDGYLLYATPTRMVSVLVDYCQIYCGLTVLGTQYKLRVKVDSLGRIRVGEVSTDWHTGSATYEADVPIFGILGGASAGQNRLVFNPNQFPQAATWNTSLGFKTANAGENYVFGLACVSTGAFTPVAPEDAMTWGLVGLIVRS